MTTMETDISITIYRFNCAAPFRERLCQQPGFRDDDQRASIVPLPFGSGYAALC